MGKGRADVQKLMDDFELNIEPRNVASSMAQWSFLIKIKVLGLLLN